VKGHVSVDAAAYRDAVKHDQELERDPVVFAAGGIGNLVVLDAYGREARDEVAAALAAAHAEPFPDKHSA
jgi:pyruvate dehydrogenase E1 component alpha subunit